MKRRPVRILTMLLLLAVLLLTVACKKDPSVPNKTEEPSAGSTAPASDLQPTEGTSETSETPTETQEETLAVGRDTDIGYGIPNGIN